MFTDLIGCKQFHLKVVKIKHLFCGVKKEMDLFENIKDVSPLFFSNLVVISKHVLFHEFILAPTYCKTNLSYFVKYLISMYFFPLYKKIIDVLMKTKIVKITGYTS